MNSFDPNRYAPICRELLVPRRLNELGPAQPNVSVQSQLAALTPHQLAGDHAVRSPEMLECCLAGLWLYHDFLDESHRRSQEIESREGSYWHGIMHRREPDFWNSKYWFRKVGTHPVFSDLAEAARALAQETTRLPRDANFLIESEDWDPMAFVDLCEVAYRGQSHTAELCRQIARAEWELLFDYCYQAGIGGSMPRP